MANTPERVPTNSRTFVHLAVRRFLRDDPRFNTLLSGFETNDEQLDLCITLALSDWNTTPPLIGFVSTGTHPSGVLLIVGTIIQVLVSAGILQSRNQLNYTAGGVTVQVSDKAQQYQSWLNLLVAQYENQKNRLKQAINLESCWGGIPSEYAYVAASGAYAMFGLDGQTIDSITGGQ